MLTTVFVCVAWRRKLAVLLFLITTMAWCDLVILFLLLFRLLLLEEFSVAMNVIRQIDLNEIEQTDLFRIFEVQQMSQFFIETRKRDIVWLQVVKDW